MVVHLVIAYHSRPTSRLADNHGPPRRPTRPPARTSSSVVLQLQTHIDRALVPDVVEWQTASLSQWRATWPTHSLTSLQTTPLVHPSALPTKVDALKWHYQQRSLKTCSSTDVGDGTESNMPTLICTSTRRPVHTPTEGNSSEHNIRKDGRWYVQWNTHTVVIACLLTYLLAFCCCMLLAYFTYLLTALQAC